MRALLSFAAAAAFGVVATMPATAATLDDVKARGTLSCGVNAALPGFAAEKDGRWSGFDADFCRAVAAAALGDEATTVKALRDRFEAALLAQIPGVQLNGDALHRLPNTSNLAFEGVESETLLLLLDRAGVCCSAGSACTAGSIHPSHVLRAMGYSTERARSSLRFSFSRFNTEAEVDEAVRILSEAVAKVRAA